MLPFKILFNLCFFVHSEYGSNFYELTNKIQAQSPVPWLTVVLQLLQEAQEVTQDFIDKVRRTRKSHA